MSEYAYYLIDSAFVHYCLTREGYIFGGPHNIASPSGQWRAVRLQHVVKTTWTLDIQHVINSSDGWEIYKRHELFKNGRSQWHLIDYDHGSYRRWGSRVTLSRF